MKTFKYILTICFGVFFTLYSGAQEKEAIMTLSFAKVDASDVCNVLVVSEGKPVADITVKLFVERLFGLLPIGKDVTTDEMGLATFEFPANIPFNSDGKLIVLAKVEDDENYGSFEIKSETNIGVKEDLTKLEKAERSLSGSRDNAPIYFIVASISIIIGIWGTLIYVVLQIFKIKRKKTITT
jgi:hypothetical protein